MNDGKVSITTALAWIGWTLSGMFAASSLLAAALHGRTTTLGMFLCTVSILIAGAAATIHVRSFLCGFSGLLKEAYRMGCDKGRLDALDEQGAMPPLQRVH